MGHHQRSGGLRIFALFFLFSVSSFLVGGFKYFLFSSLPGEDSHFD